MTSFALKREICEIGQHMDFRSRPECHTRALYSNPSIIIQISRSTPSLKNRLEDMVAVAADDLQEGLK